MYLYDGRAEVFVIQQLEGSVLIPDNIYSFCKRPPNNYIILYVTLEFHSFFLYLSVLLAHLSDESVKLAVLPKKKIFTEQFLS